MEVGGLLLSQSQLSQPLTLSLRAFYVYACSTSCGTENDLVKCCPASARRPRLTSPPFPESFTVTAAPAPFLSHQNETHAAFAPISLMIKFIVMVNKQGQTRLARYYGVPPTESRCSAAAARHTLPCKCSMTRLQVQE